MYSYNEELVDNYKIDQILRTTFDRKLSINSVQGYEINDATILRRPRHRSLMEIRYSFKNNMANLEIRGVLKAQEARNMLAGENHNTMFTVFYKIIIFSFTMNKGNSLKLDFVKLVKFRTSDHSKISMASFG